MPHPILDSCSSKELDPEAHEHIYIRRDYSLSWSELSYKVRQRGEAKYILSDLNGHVKPGQMLAIMGPSGCGKTTLMNLLADRVSSGTIEGDILIGGNPRNEDYRFQACYVAQENALLDVLTVRENLDFAAALTMPSWTPPEVRVKRIEDIITEMGLQTCEDTRVGGNYFRGISGGQMKRLSVALSLISNPCILLLDEPTSKLDSAASYNMMVTIKALADKGKTILFSIHQPSSEIYNMFDQLLILTGGSTVYYGKTSDAVSYFSEQGYSCPTYSNPADYFLSVVNVDFKTHGDISTLLNAYNDSSLRKQVVEEIKRSKEESLPPDKFVKYRANFFIQFYYLSLRAIKNTALNPRVFLFRVVMYGLFTSLVGYLFSGTDKDEIESASLIALMFFVLLFLCVQTFGALSFFLVLRPVFIRERSNGMLDCLPFVLANFVTGLPVLFASALLASGILVFWLDLNNYWWIVATVYATILAAESLAHLISAVSPYFVIAVSLSIVCYIYGAMCEGFLVPEDELPFPYLPGYYAGFLSYAFQNLVYNEFESYPNSTVLEDYDVADTDRVHNISIISSMMVVFETLFFLVLYFVHNGKQ